MMGWERASLHRRRLHGFIGADQAYLVWTGGLGDTKGVNLPNVIVNLPAITKKDTSDILFGVAQKVDLIAASFIRKAADVLEIRKLLGDSGIKIISKIENQEGLNNFDEILAV